MNLMLAAMFGFLLVGLLPRQVRRRQTLVVAIVAIVLTALYFFFPTRYM